MGETRYFLVLLPNLLEETSQGFVGEEAGLGGTGGEVVVVQELLLVQIWAGDIGGSNDPSNGVAVGVGWEGIGSWGVRGRLAACPCKEVASCPGDVEW